MKRYIIYFDANNMSRLGYAGITITRYNSWGMLVMVAIEHCRYYPELTQAYLLNDYPQSLCELSGIDFYNKVKELSIKQLI